MRDDELHADEAHPEFEYARTKSHEQYPADGGDGWNENRARGINGSEYAEGGPVAYWRRRKIQPAPRRRYEREYYPATLDDLLSSAGIRVPEEYL